MIPFVIVADLRTGSTLLSTSLDCHPEIRCYGELFHPEDLPDNQLDAVSRQELNARQLIDEALAVSEFKAVGFRAMVFLPTDSHPHWADAWECLAELDDLHGIWLTRRDRLSQYVSALVAQHTGVYHPFDNDPLLRPENRPTITVDPQHFRRWIQERDRLTAQRRARLAGKPSLELDYEALTEHWPETIARVQKFLGVAHYPLEQGKRKQESRPLAQIIANYHELRW